MTYGKEDTDYRTEGDPSSGYVFNAAESVFFCRVRDLMKSELQTMYISCESKNCWSSTSLINQFDEKQNEWCEELWRLDYVRKYERPYRDGNTRFLEQMMNGKKKYQRRQFERDQEMYMATKFYGTTATSNQIMFRCNTPKSAVVKPDYTLHLTPFSDMYLSVMFGNSSPTQVRAKAGQQYDIKCPYDTMDDTAVLIYGASRIQSVGDVSKCYIHDNDFSKAEKLKELIIGNNTEGYSNTFLTNLVIGNNKLLEKLDIRNTPSLTSSLDLSKCMSLKELYASGSGLKGVLFANGGNIYLAQLPDTLTSINMKNLMYLTNLSIAGYDSINTVVIENCGTIDIKDLLNKSKNINRARLIGVDWTLDDTSLLERIYNMSGIDNNGYNTDQSILTGKVYVPTIRQQQLLDYKKTWNDLEITFNTMIEQFAVTFKNEDGTTLEVQYVDKGGSAVDPTTRAENPLIPKKESTISHDFTFAGWDSDLTNVFSERTITATYTSSLRKYTIRYVSKGITMQESTGLYGENVPYTGTTPVYTSEESGYVYYLFNRWDNSGFINGDKTVNAIFDSFTYTPDAFKGKELADLTPVEIYAMNKLNMAESIVTDKDAYTLQIGNDVDYDDIDSKLLVSEKTNFDGTNYVDTGIKLFDEDKDFVLAIDYEFLNGNKSNAVLAQCFQANGSNGFKLMYSNTNDYNGARFVWGTTSDDVVSVNKREIIVIRHKKGDNNITIYKSNLDGDEVLKVDIARTKSTIGTGTLVFGSARADDGLYENYAIGNINWAKVWYKDLGEDVCTSLAMWTHETIELEACGFRKYYLSNNTSKRCSFSLLAKNLLGRTKRWNPTNTSSGGWAKSSLNKSLNDRLYNAIPTQFRSLMKQVIVYSSVGGMSNELSTSDCYITIPSIVEVDSTMNSEPYNSEGSAISYLNTNDSRKRSFVDGDYNAYWLRSPNVSYANYVYRVDETGAPQGITNASNYLGVLIEISL